MEGLEEEAVEAFGPPEEDYSREDLKPLLRVSGSIAQDEQPARDEEENEPRPQHTTSFDLRKAMPMAEVSLSTTFVGDVGGVTQFLEVGDFEEGANFGSDLQQWLTAMKVERANMAAQLAEVEERQQCQVAEFEAEIELLKKQHADEILLSAQAASIKLEEELRTAESKRTQDIDQILAENEQKRGEELEPIKKTMVETGTQCENGHGSGEETGCSTKKEGGGKESLIPRLSPQLSPVAQKELKLQKERLQRQHRSELKALEHTLRSAFAVEREALEQRLEEEMTAKLAEAVTSSALKNAAQVEEISRELRAEKDRALSQLEQEQEERRRREAVRLTEERRDIVETCQTEFELAKSELTARIATLEEALDSEQYQRQAEVNQKEVKGEKETEEEEVEDEGLWKKREEKLRIEIESKWQRILAEHQQESAAEREIALETLQTALEEGLQNELRQVHEVHTQTLAQVQTSYEEKLAVEKEKTQSLNVQLLQMSQEKETRGQEVNEASGRLREVTEKLQAVHRAEMMAVKTEMEVERGRHIEEVERVREEMETQLHQGLTQLTQSHRSEVGNLETQYQSQLEALTLSHQQSLSEMRGTVEREVKVQLEEQSTHQLSQIENSYSSQLRVLEGERDEKIAIVQRELEIAKEEKDYLSTQFHDVKEKLLSVESVVAGQRERLQVMEEERDRLFSQVETEDTRDKEREEQRERQLREDTASLAILQKQLNTLTSEKEILQSSLVMLQSSMAGCVQLAGLVKQTLYSSPLLPSISSSSHFSSDPPSVLNGDDVENRGGDERGEEEGTTTSPPRPLSTTSSSPPAGGGTNSGAVSMTSVNSVVWSKSGSLLLGLTPSDDSGLASQQASVANSEATPMVTPAREEDAEESTAATSPPPISDPYLMTPVAPVVPDLTILPLDDTTGAMSFQDLSQVPGLSFDQSQIGMLSVSLLDLTQHTLPPPPPTPHTTSSSSGVATTSNSSLSLNIPQLSAMQEELSGLQESVTALLKLHITVATEAAGYRKELMKVTSEADEALSSMESLREKIEELERESELKEKVVVESQQTLATAQEEVQILAGEGEGYRAENENLNQQLTTAQKTLSTMEQKQRETESALQEKAAEMEAQKATIESLESQSTLRVQMFDSQITQLRDELSASQRHTASAVHEKDAMHQENKKLSNVQMSLEREMRQLGDEALARQRDFEYRLKQREDEIRELETVRNELTSTNEANEALRAERDGLKQQLGGLEHELALSQAVASEDLVEQVQQLKVREEQLVGEVRQRTATIQALQERVHVAQESLNQTTQETLNVKLSQAQLEGEVNRLRDELQRRETALHRAQVKTAQQTQLVADLQAARIAEEKARMQAQEEEEDYEGEEEKEDAGLEEEEEEETKEHNYRNGVTAACDKSSDEVVRRIQQELLQQQQIHISLENQITLLRETLTSKDRELETLRLVHSRQDEALKQARAQLKTGGEQSGIEKENGLNSSSTHSLLSTSTFAGDETGSRSILRRIAELAPALSQEAQTVNHLSKNSGIPELNVEQLTVAIDSLGEVVSVLSRRTGGGGGKAEEEEVVDVLGAVQRLVQELTVVLSSLDHGHLTQLPQQLSMINDLLSQLMSSDREALIRDITHLKDTISSLRTQLQQQSDVIPAEAKKVFAENEELRRKLEIKSSYSVQLENQIKASRTTMTRLEMEVKGLQQQLATVTSDLERARSELVGESRFRKEKYQQSESSLKKSITLLQQELKISLERQAELERIVKLHKESDRKLVQNAFQCNVPTDSLLKDLESERRAKDELTVCLTTIQTQLKTVKVSLQNEKTEKSKLRLSLEERERESKRAREEVKKVERMCRERDTELDSIKTCLLSLESDNKQQSEHYVQLLENEKRKVLSLRSSLQTKERKLTEATDKYLQEVVELKKQLECKQNYNKDELVRLRELLAMKEKEVTLLQQKMDSLDTLPPPSSKHPHDLLQSKLMRLYVRYREAEVHRRALVFQKNYLKAQVDAFFQTQQVALIMMADMGAPRPTQHHHQSKSPLSRWKMAIHVAMAVYRFGYVVRRKDQYITSYSRRVEKEKSAALAEELNVGSKSAGGIDAILGSHRKPPSLLPITTMTSHFPPSPPPTTAKQSKTTRSTLKVGQYSSHKATFSSSASEHLSTAIPSLAKLQAKLNSASH